MLWDNNLEIILLFLNALKMNLYLKSIDLNNELRKYNNFKLDYYDFIADFDISKLILPEKVSYMRLKKMWERSSIDKSLNFFFKMK